MEHHLTTLCTAHFGYALTAYDAITLHYQYIIIMCIGAYEAAVVLDDDKLPIAPKSTTAIRHLPISGSVYRLAESAGNIDALSL